MDFADDVAYSVHDVEDGIVAGRIELTQLARDAGLRHDDLGDRPRLVPARLPRPTSSRPHTHRLSAARRRGRGRRTTGAAASLAGLKNLTSRLINRFCSGVQEAVASAGLPRPLVRYAADIPVPAEIGAEIAVLKGIAAHLVMKADDRVAALTSISARCSPSSSTAIWDRATPARSNRSSPPTSTPPTTTPPDCGVVVDQVASLTDPSAVDSAPSGLSRTA